MVKSASKFLFTLAAFGFVSAVVYGGRGGPLRRPPERSGPLAAAGAVGGGGRLVEMLRLHLRLAGCRADFTRPWHAFRHTFASLFLEQGGAQPALERIIGHSTSGNQVTAGYVHVDLAYLARELDRMRLQPQPEARIIPLRATA